ncbi:PTS lactose/cellobiose transporter subunit IIA [Clostridium sp. AL.422]|uniref:PTS lactose/cellobiose transporter subunit IIA n=1 Tax=Clostridium TaxID=1485 RepID=UPI00293DC626|nr:MULTISPECIES: PTS lactose/cellobiose transporter subunit IIA [unclassified Clostridium]MDV4150365.1 PTS lactose/cellobiose transporter subunit IIA [Clostridium sp. AL.422]
MSEMEMQVMQIIGAAGESKAKAFQALKKVKERDYKGARELMEEARDIDLEAHNAQTKLIQAELSGEAESKPVVNLLMVHAQDHYMSSQLSRDLIEVLIEVFESREEK